MLGVRFPPGLPDVERVLMANFSLARSTEKGKEFYQSVVGEIRKTTFPSREDTVGSTGIVFILVIMLSVYLALVDGVFSRIMSAILS